MGAWTRQLEFHDGDFLTTCAYHPFTFRSSDTYIDDQGRVRCKQFCKGRLTERSMDRQIAVSHKRREAPAPPHTRPRHGGTGRERPYARWPMQTTVALLEDVANGHDGDPDPDAATLVDGRLGKAFRFDGGDGYDVHLSTGANATTLTGFALAAWVKPATGAALAGVVTKTDTGLDGFRLRAADLESRIAVGVTELAATITAGWHHLAADLTPAGALTLYVDGVSVAMVGSVKPASNIVPVRVGAGLNADAYDCRYYQRPFEVGELAEVMGP